MPPTPFLIGVDLGTTNSAVAAVDTRRRHPRVEVFRIPQLTAPGVVEPWPVLPSFLYFPEPDEIAGRRHRAAVGAQSQRHRRRAGARSRCAGACAAGGLCEIVARPSRGRSARGLPSLGQHRLHPARVARRCVGAVSDAPARRVERDDGGRRRGGAVRAAVDRAHRAGVIRRRGPRADRRSGAGGAVVHG